MGFWEPIGAGSVYALKYGKTRRKAVLKYNWNFHQSTPIAHPPFPDRVIIVGGETHYMYRNPIYLFLQDKFPDLQVGTYYADPFLLARKAKVFGSDDCEVEKIALTPAVATSELLDLLGYPKLQVIFPTTPVYWTQIFDYWETYKGYRIDDCIYYNFAFRPPSPDQEYDACMGEPGVYIGVGGRPPGP